MSSVYVSNGRTATLETQMHLEKNKTKRVTTASFEQLKMTKQSENDDLDLVLAFV